MLAYKSVLRGLILSLFTAFSVSDILRYDSTLIIDLYCELFRNQPELCHIFWEEDFQNEARGILLTITKQEFPFRLGM